MARKRIDLTGKTFHRLSVNNYAGTNRSGQSLWQCTCVCGNTTTTEGCSLQKGVTKSCGCLRKESKGTPAEDITGRGFGRWTVLMRAENRGTAAFWQCVCICGTISEVGGSALRNGSSRSCGCLQIDIKRKCTGPAHPRWKGIKKRDEERRAQMQSVCEICDSGKNLCWDHNHATGEYRATLCDTCNRVVGLFKESPERFDQAAAFLRRHQAKTAA